MDATASYLQALSWAAQTLDLRYALIEGMGVFWLGAEMAILFLVCEGRRYLERPSPWTERLPGPGAGRRAVLWGAGFAGLLVFIGWRHFVQAGTCDLIQQGAFGDPVDLEALQRAVRAQNHRHLFIWWCFVNLWVLFEAWIVVEGIRGYRRLREILGARAGGGHAGGGAAALLVVFLLCTFPAWAVAPLNAPELVPAMRRALAEDAAYRDAMYLYLRIAGVSWVAIEWVAAVFLWRAYRLLRAARKAGHD